jgi:hypothetical protein
MKSPMAADGQCVPQCPGIALMYSGGLDSTYEVVQRLETYCTVYLLTFDNGCCSNMRGPRSRVDELRGLFGHERIFHRQVNTAALIERLAGDMGELRRRYNTHWVFDLVCQLSSTLELICLARSHGVTHITDGASHAQTEVFMQDPQFGEHKRPFIEAQGIEYRRSVGFDVSREDKQHFLRERSLRSGSKVLEKLFPYLHISSSRLYQPFCSRVIINHPWIDDRTRFRPWVVERSLPVPKATQLWDELLPAAQAYLDERLGASA